MGSTKTAAGDSGAAGGSGGRVAHIGPQLEARKVVDERSRFRRYLWRSGIVLVVGGVGMGAWVLMHSSLLAARVITITGAATPAQRAAVLRASGLGTHPPLLDVDARTIGAAVDRLPWVKDARLALHWPDGVGIAVERRRPVAALARSLGGYAEVDRTGRVLGVTSGAPSGLPQLRGSAEPGRPGTWLPRWMLPGLDVAGSLPPALRGLVADVDVQAAGQVELQLTAPVTVALGTDRELRQKYADAAAILAGASLQVGDVVDVSVPKSPEVLTSPSG